MFIPPFFKRGLTQANVVASGFCRGGNCGLVYNAWSEALAVEGACVTSSAATCLGAGGRRRGQYLGVVGTNNGCHVLGAAVADLYGVPIENAPVPVTFVKVDVH